jgi:hypothetical protein
MYKYNHKFKNEDELNTFLDKVEKLGANREQQINVLLSLGYIELIKEEQPDEITLNINIDTTPEKTTKKTTSK